MALTALLFGDMSHQLVTKVDNLSLKGNKADEMEGRRTCGKMFLISKLSAKFIFFKQEKLHFCSRQHKLIGRSVFSGTIQGACDGYLYVSTLLG